MHLPVPFIPHSCTPLTLPLPQELATRLSERCKADPVRITEERKKRNYADFWTPISINEPFRVVLAYLRDRWGGGRGSGGEGGGGGALKCGGGDGAVECSQNHRGV
jgi:hypothetical protein